MIVALLAFDCGGNWLERKMARTSFVGKADDKRNDEGNHEVDGEGDGARQVMMAANEGVTWCIYMIPSL